MTDASAPPVRHVTTEIDEGVLIARIDDGKANALSHAIIDDLNAAVDTATNDNSVKALAIIGRPGKFSAGFDLSVMQSSPEAARDLLRAGADLGLRLFLSPVPVVFGVTGHALAMGSILQFCADERIGAAGPFKLGMNEVSIGMPIPRFAVELARDRLSKRHFHAATQQARLYDPAGAVEAGYLDSVVALDDVEKAAIDHAKMLAATLNGGAFRLTRTYVRQAIADRVEQDLDEDMRLFNIG